MLHCVSPKMQHFLPAREHGVEQRVDLQNRLFIAADAVRFGIRAGIHRGEADRRDRRHHGLQRQAELRVPRDAGEHRRVFLIDPMSNRVGIVHEHAVDVPLRRVVCKELRKKRIRFLRAARRLDIQRARQRRGNPGQ